MTPSFLTSKRHQTRDGSGSGDEYVELLPRCWRTINAYGIKLNHRTYDGAELNPLRRQDSGVAARKHLWEVHYDPYDVTRIWVRNHWGAGVDHTVPWRHLGSVPVPFGELANVACLVINHEPPSPNAPARSEDQLVPTRGIPLARDVVEMEREHIGPHGGSE